MTDLFTFGNAVQPLGAEGRYGTAGDLKKTQYVMQLLGFPGDPDTLWSLDELVALRRSIEAEGLVLEAVENFDPAHWHQVLFDGPERDRHIENCQTTIRRLGALKPKTICFSQYGQRRDPAFIVETAERQLNEYYDLILNQLKKGRRSDQIIDVIKDTLFTGRPDSHMQYQGMLGSIVSGYEVYFKRAGMIG